MSGLGIAIVLGQLVMPATQKVTLSLGDRTEGRLRSRFAGGDPAVDVETAAGAGLSFHTKRSDMLLAYGARIGYVDMFQDPAFIVTHVGSFTTGWAWSRRLHLTMGGGGSIGKSVSNALTANLTLGTPAKPPPVTFTPPVSVINVASFHAEAGASYQLSRTWGSQAGVAYAGGEGLDTASRALIPFYHGPSGSIAAAYAASRRDSLTSAVVVGYTMTPRSGATYLASTATETWGHGFSKRTTGSVGAGVSWLLAKPTRDASERSSFFPNGLAGIKHTIPLGRGESLTFGGSTSVSLAFDPVLGLADPAAGASAVALWTIPHYGVSTGVDVLTTIPTDSSREPARQLAGNATVWYEPVKLVRFDVGVRAFWLDLRAPAVATAANAPNSIQWAAFLGVAVQAPPISL